MTRFRLSSIAQSDLLEAWLYVAQDSVDAADRLLDEIYAKLELIGTHTDLGEARPDIPIVGCRSTLVKNYVIFYRVTDEIVEIARILHGSRDITRWNG